MAQDIQVQTIFSVTDRANAPLQNIARSANNVAQSSNTALMSVQRLAGMAGIAGLGFAAINAARSTVEYLDTVKRISSITGEGARSASALYGALQMGGVEAQVAERLMLGLSRASDAIDMGGQQGERMSQAFRRLGVDVRAGPLAALTALAVQAQRGALHTTQLAMLLRVRPQAAIPIMAMLQRGPAALAESMRLAREAGLEVTDEQLGHFREMQHAQHEMAAVWRGLGVQIGVAVIPAMTRLLRGVREQLTHFTPLARAAGAGIAGMAGRLGVGGAASAAGAALGIPGLGLAIAALQGFAGHIESVSVVMNNMHALWSRAAPTVMRVFELFSQLGSTLGAFLAGVLPAVSGAVAEVGGALMDVVDATVSAVDRVWSALRPSLAPLMTAVSELASKMGEFVSTVFSGFSDDIRNATPALIFLGNVAIGAAIGATKLLTAIMDLVNWIQSHLPRSIPEMAAAATANAAAAASRAAGDAAYAAMNQTQRAAGWQAVTGLLGRGARAASGALESVQQNAAVAVALAGGAAAAAAAPPVPPDARGAGVYQDFRGSRFEVRQNFAEGFDPGRVAVAFTGDLAALGERRLQSGFSPLFAVR